MVKIVLLVALCLLSVASAQFQFFSSDGRQVTSANQDLGTTVTYSMSTAGGAPNIVVTASTSADYTINPSVLNFTKTNGGPIAFSITGGSNVASENIRWNITGPDAANYANGPIFPVLFVRRSILISSNGQSSYPPTDLVVGVPSNSFAFYLSTPATNGVSFTFSSNAAVTVSPNPIVFSDTVREVNFNIVANTKGNVQLVFTPSDPTLYNSYNVTVFVSARTFIGNDFYNNLNAKVHAQSQTLRLSTDYAPPQGVTLTPHADGVTFANDLVFAANTDNAQTTFTANKIGSHLVYWTISGPDADLFELPFNTTIDVTGLSFVIVPPAKKVYVVGQTSDRFTIYTQNAPASDVSVTLTPSACANNVVPTILPSKTIIFSSTGSLSNTFTVKSSQICSGITFDVSITGTNFEDYAAILPSQFGTISFNKIIVTASPLANTISCGDSTTVTLSSNNPAISSFTVIPSGPGYTFTPSSVSFTASSARTATFKVTSTYLTFSTIKYVVTGTDASIVASINPTFIAVNPKAIQFVPGSIDTLGGTGGLLAGTTSTVQHVTLSKPPTTSLTVNLNSPGLTISPSSLTYGPGQTDQTFTVSSAQVNAHYVITYSFASSSADAGCFSDPSGYSTAVDIVPLQIETFPGFNVVDLGVMSAPYTINIPHLPVEVTVTPVVVDENGNVNSAVVFFPPTITLSPTAPAGVFTYKSSSLLDDLTYFLKYIITPDAAAALVSTAQITPPAFNRRTFNLPQSLNAFNTVYRAAQFFAGVASSSQMVTLDDYPIAPVTLTPSAPNTIFSPSVLTFDATTKTATFTILSSDGAAVKSITWTVSDPVNYNPVPQTTFAVVLKEITVSNVNSLSAQAYYVNTPIPFTLTTLQTPATPIVVTPSGGFFTFSPASITLSETSTAASFVATPSSFGDTQFYFTITGADAVNYSPIDPVAISTMKNGFRIDSIQSTGIPVLTLGSTSAPFRIRTNTRPSAAGVTLTLSSPQVTITPNTFTFTSTADSAVFTMTLIPNFFTTFGVPNGQSNIEIISSISGADEPFFDDLPLTTLGVVINSPSRTLTASTGSISVNIGDVSHVTITTPLAPVTSVTLTPFVDDSSYVVTPATATLTPTSRSAVFGVTRTSHSTSNPSLYFAVSGPDAAFYKDPLSVTLNPSNGQIVVLGVPFAFTVMQPIPNMYLQLYNAPSQSVTITPTVISGASFTFTPAQITVTPGQSVAYFSATPTSVGAFVIVFNIEGSGASAFDRIPSLRGTVGLINIISPLDGFTAPVGGYKLDTSILLTAALKNGVTITPTAAGITFSPASVNFAAGQLSSPVSMTVNSNRLASSLLYDISGPDAGFVNNPCQDASACIIQSGEGIISASYNGGSSLHGTYTVQMSPSPTTAITVTPSAPGVRFTPSSWTFTAASNPSKSFDVFATSRAIQTPIPATFTFSGPDAVYYRMDSLAPEYMYFEGFAVQPFFYDGGNAIPVGSVSAPITITLPNPPTNGAPIPSAWIVPTADRPGITFYPSNLTLDQSTGATNAATFSVSSNTIGAFVVSFPMSGPGATYYAATAVTTTVNFVPATFEIASNLYTNRISLGNSDADTFVYGVESQRFTIYCRSAPVPVTLQLVSDGFSFNPSELKFDNHTQAVTFTITGKKVGPTSISYNMITSNPELFTLPGTVGLDSTPTLYVSYDVQVGQIPVMHVGQLSDDIEVSINPAPRSSYALFLAGGPHVYSPNTLVFTPSSTKQKFNILPLSATIAQPSGVNIPGTSGSVTNGGAAAVLLMKGSDGSDAAGADARGVPQATYTSIIVARGTFNVHHPRYQMNEKTEVEVSISNLPRSDVTLSLWGNNMVYDPPYVVFRAGGDTTQTVSVTPRSASSYDVNYAPFKVDYAVSGTNAPDYVAPSESFHYIALTQGYIAAVVLFPILFIALCVGGYILARRFGGRRSVGGHV